LKIKTTALGAALATASLVAACGGTTTPAASAPASPTPSKDSDSSTCTRVDALIQSFRLTSSVEGAGGGSVTAERALASGLQSIADTASPAARAALMPSITDVRSEASASESDGSRVVLNCYETGQTITNDVGQTTYIWDFVSWSSFQGFVPDVFIRTGTTDPIVPQCTPAILSTRNWSQEQAARI
jgi:hypothetical protein